jgi:hypothetical protein
MVHVKNGGNHGGGAAFERMLRFYFDPAAQCIAKKFPPGDGLRFNFHPGSSPFDSKNLIAAKASLSRQHPMPELIDSIITDDDAKFEAVISQQCILQI